MTSTLTLKPKDARLLAERRDALEQAADDLYTAKQARDRAVLLAADHGATLRDIAEVLGISHQAVDKIVKGQV